MLSEQLDLHIWSPAQKSICYLYLRVIGLEKVSTAEGWVRLSRAEGSLRRDEVQERCGYCDVRGKEKG